MKPQYIEIDEDEDKFYYSDKEMRIFHREGGPAIEYANGSYKVYYLNGKRHNENGPAIEWHNGDKAWYLDGIEYSEKEFNKKMNNTPKLQQTADSECKPETYSLWGAAFKNGKRESVKSTDLFVWACVNTKTGEVAMEEVRAYDDELDADLVEGWEWRRFRLVEATV